MKAGVWVIVGLMAGVCLKADYTTISMCVGEDGEQVRPDIEGDFVVWEGNSDISLAMISQAGSWTVVTDAGAQDYAAVSSSRGIILWRDKSDSSDYAIAGCDFSGNGFVLSEADGSHQRNPKVSANYIVCEDNIGGSYNIAVYDVSSDSFVRIDPVSAVQMDVDLDGDRVVWRDGRDGLMQIYQCDLSVVPYVTSQVYPQEAEQWNPAVSGNVVVWEDHTNDPNTNLIAYDLSLNQIVWTNTYAGTQMNPAICGGLIVWQEKPDGQTDYDIRGYDMEAGVWLEIATDEQNDTLPAISGRTVVWQRNGTDIMAANVPEIGVLSVTCPAGGEQVLTGATLTIDWTMTRGTLPDEVMLEFSPDNGTSWAVIEPNIPADAPYIWQAADVNSPLCRIQVSAVDSEVVSGISEQFTIFQCASSLTADLTGDCFVGMDDIAVLAAQWLTCGNPYDAICITQ